MNEVLAANMAALATRSRSLAAAVQNAPSHPDLAFLTSRSGESVPMIEIDGRKVTFHSRYAPIVEAQRRFEQTGPAGFVVFLGLGAGYHINPFLESAEFEAGVIIEYDERIVRALLGAFPLVPILADARLELLIDPTPDEVNSAVCRAFLPVVTERFSVVPLDGRVRLAREAFARASAAARAAAEAQIADFTVQRRLGLRWTSNSLANIANAVETRAFSAFADHDRFQSNWRRDSRTRLGRVAIVGAGPTLEDNLAEIANADTVLSTDTALPALVAYGLMPDMVVSVDAQIYSYHHLLCSRMTEVPWFLDLAACPSVSRRVNRLFFVGSHPLSRLIAAWFYPMLTLPRPGGNVTQTALSLAYTAGADAVDIYGADFSYPNGKPYARGTYLNRYFESRANRYAPTEGVLLGFARDADSAYRVTDAANCEYRTPSLDAYRIEITEFAATLPIRVTRHNERRPPHNSSRTTARRAIPPPHTPIREPDERLTELWFAFLERYHTALRSLPRPSAPVSRWFRSLDGDHAAAAATILPPLAAHDTRGVEDVSTAVTWCLDRVERHMQ